MEDFNEKLRLIERVLEGKASRREEELFTRLLEAGKLNDVVDQDTKKHFSEQRIAMPPERREVVWRHIQQKRRATRPAFAWMAAAAVAAIVTTVALYFYRGSGFPPPQKTASAEHVITAAHRGYVRLSDGTSIYLDNGSKLTYGDTFGAKTREVTLSGKAYFDVAHDPSRPFKVHTANLVTTVLGTAFNITAYPEQSDVTVTVARGKVAVGDQERVYEELSRNQEITVNTTDLRFETKTVQTEKVIAWKNEYFVLDKVTIEEAAHMIGERFGVKVNVENGTIEQCVISIWFANNENLEKVMTMIAALRQARYTIEGTTVTVTGGTACD